MNARSNSENNERLLDQGKKLLEFLRDQEEAEPFLEPVDPIALNLPTYPKLIKNPMDLLTVEEKLIEKQYPDLKRLLEDVDLIWKNCMIFNTKNSVSYI